VISFADPREESLCTKGKRQEGEVGEGQNDGRKAGWHSSKAGNRAKKFSAVQTSAGKLKYVRGALNESEWPEGHQHFGLAPASRPAPSA
jgi:hypothetical protein